MMKSSAVVCVSLVVIFSGGDTATAHTPFKKPFDEKYVKASGNAEFKVAFRKAGCNVCHVKGKSKDWLNPYGLALAKHVPGNTKERLDAAKAVSDDALKAENEKLLEELKTALKEAESARTKDGVLFRTLFEEHKLPPEEGAKSLYAEDEETAVPSETEKRSEED